MGISVSLLLAAAGAALIWAVNATVSGVNIHTIGIILLIVLLALGGGIFLSKLLFIVLIVALVVAVLARRSTA